MSMCVCNEGIGQVSNTTRRVRGLGRELAQPPSSDLEEFYPVGSGLGNALFRKVRAAMAAVEETGEILLSPGKDLAPYVKAVRRWAWLRRRLEAHLMGEGPVVWEHPPTLVPIELGTGEGRALPIPDDCSLVIGNFFKERRPA